MSKQTAAVVLILSLLGMAVYLIIQEHPCWGALFVLTAFSIDDERKS